MKGKKLNRDFFAQPTLQVARKLLGKYLVLKQNGIKLSGKIVETEAYVGKEDPASHAFGKVTPRNQIMYGPPGYTYIYFIYGNYYCLNFVTEKAGFPAAVLIRALEPREGIKTMHKNRDSLDLKNLTNGPGKLCQAFGIDRSFNTCDLTANFLFVEDRGEKVDNIGNSERIGIYRGIDRKWRFFILNNNFVSKIRS
ncbi:MAG: 3-methyladenine DNA glycosylase [candidate division Zixibacteria bacterium RBG-1]|nr:MAG: 3-methyladenine DNA glycosylase [candidate division Zixibacteria bacterium RBG-1]OGC85724.1 MAG: hypothetical protein A2V73_01430 [candidate division Zixibacteria bacterium RBG_19FT_COMBO_42_43]